MPIPGASEDDLNYIQRLDRMRATSTAPVDIAVASNIQQLSYAYPGMSPGVAYALGRSGVTPGAQAQKIWQRELQTKMGREPGVKPKRRQPRKSLDQRKVEQAFELGGGGLGSVMSDIVAPITGVLPEALRPGFRGATGTAPGQPDPLGIERAPIVKEVQSGIKTGVRGATIALMAPLEAGVGALRAAGTTSPFNPGHTNAAPLNPLEQVQAIGEQTTAAQVISGKSAGEGYLPSWDSPAMEAQAESARKYSPYLIGGHAWTPGHAVADTVFEPDDVAFDLASGAVDASIAMSKLDPAGFGLAKVAQARAAGKTWATADELEHANMLAAGGAIKGVRKGFSPRSFEAERNTEKMQTFFRRVAEEDSALNIHHATKLPYSFIGPNHEQIPIIKYLRDAKTPDEVADIYGRYAGTYIDEVTKFRGNKVQGAPRWATSVPKAYIPGNPDLDDLARIGDDALVNARVPYAQRETFANLAADAIDKPKQVAALELHAEVMKQQLIHAGGLSESEATKMTRYWKTDTEQLSNFMADDMGRPITTPGMVTIDGHGQPVPHIMLPSQLLTRATKMPDAREVRKAVSSFSAYYNNHAVEGITDIADAALVPWRKLMLMRAAWGVRVVGEEQIRIATQVNSLFHHPMSAVSWIIGNPDSHWVDKLQDWQEAGGIKGALGGPIADQILGLKATTGRGMTDVLGNTFLTDDLYRQSNYRRFDELRGRADRIYLDNFSVVDAAGPKGAEALAEEIARLHEDGLVRGLLEQPSVAAAREWFWFGDGADIRNYLAQDPALHLLGTSREVADQHVNSVLKGLFSVTGEGNPSLYEAAKTGMIGDGVPIMVKGQVNEDALPHFKALIDDPDVAHPTRIRMREYHTLTPEQQRKFDSKLARGFDQLFEALMPRPSDYLSRSPTFRQYYWQRAEELIAEHSPEDRLKIIEEARNANLDNATISRMLQKHARIPAELEPRLTREAGDMIAKQFALKETKGLLYDLSTRGQVFDVLRYAAPFGEAWREVLTTWARLAQENPQVFRRGTQVIMGARSPGSAALNKATGNDIGTGFFHKDEFGQEVFAFPATEMLTKELFGVPVPLKGSVQGLNLIGNGLPGLGPMFQLPLAYLLKNRPQGDTLKQIVTPYGSPDKNLALGAIQSYAPSWLKQAINIFDDPASARDFGATVAGVMRYFNSTGEYDLQGKDAPEEMARLVDDATEKARGVQLIRTIGAFTLPTSPSPEWLTQDKKGKLLLTWRMSKWYHDRLEKSGDPDATLEEFLDKYGTTNLLTIQGRSAANIPAADRLLSVTGSAWVGKNGDLATKYPNTYTLFAPDAGEYDNAAYERQLSRGERTPLSPKEMLVAANSRLANLIYFNKRDELEADGKLDEDDQAVIRAVKRDLLTDFPGYDPEKRTTTSDTKLFSELNEAVTDPKIRRTPAGKALKTYLNWRTQILSQQAADGMSDAAVSGGKTAARARAWLNEHGQALVEETPTFQPLWDLVLSQEVEK